MATLKQKKEYFEGLATDHYLVGHGQPIYAGSADARKSFIEIYAEDGLQSAMQNCIHSPVVVMRGKAAGRPIDKSGSIREKWFNTLWFLAKAVQTDSILLPEAKQNALDTAEGVMKDFIAKMFEQWEDEGACGDFPFKRLDWNEFSWTETGPEGDSFYGWRLNFPDEQPGTSITNSNPDHWGYAAPSAPAGGGSSGVTTVGAETGAEVAAPDDSFFAHHLTNVGNSTLQIYIDDAAIIDWGDGMIRSYPGDRVINKTYAGAGEIVIKVYWGQEADPISYVWLLPVGAATAELTGIDGEFPSLQRFQVELGLPEVPLALLPVGLKYFVLKRCGLTQEKIDDVYAWCDANGLEKGTIRTQDQTTGAVPTQGPVYLSLDTKFWTLEHD